MYTNICLYYVSSGTHILRKTFFLLAFWGSVDLEHHESRLKLIEQASILNDARHKSINSTKTYVCDSGALKVLFSRAGADMVRHKTGPYLPIFMNTMSKFDALTRDLNHKHKTHKTLYELADWYLVEKVKISRALLDVTDLNIPQLMSKVTLFTIPPTADIPAQLPALESFKAFLSTKMNDYDIKKAMLLLNESTATQVQQATNHLESVLTQGTNAEKFIIDSKSVEKKSTQDCSAGYVVLDKNYQQAVKDTRDKKDKLSLIVIATKATQQQISDGKKMPTGGTRRWLYRIATTEQCVSQCYSSDENKFLIAHPKWSPTTFCCRTDKCAKNMKHTGSFV